MRKRRKVKLHSCSICKPHKMGWENRWKPKEAERMKREDRELLHPDGLVHDVLMEEAELAEVRREAVRQLTEEAQELGLYGDDVVVGTQRESRGSQQS